MSSTATSEFPKGLGKVSRGSIGLAVLGLIVAGGGAAALGDLPERGLHLYFYGWLIAMGFSLGSYGLMLLHYVVKGSWGYPVIRLWEAGARLLPGLFVLGIPLFLLREKLYPWAQPHITDPMVLHRSAYLNASAVAVRALVYFFIWIGSTYYLTSLSRKQDELKDPTLIQARTNFSAIGMVIFVLTVNFAYTDWVMSLEAHWYSTIFGVWFVISQALCAVAIATIFTYFVRAEEPYLNAVDNGVRKDFGNLLLMLTMVWAYFSFSQWVIIWSGNLPDEIEFYLHRFSGHWLTIGAFLVVFQFFAPFVALLSGKTKRIPTLLLTVASWLLLMRFLDIAWHVFPSLNNSRPLDVVPAIGTALFVLGVWLVFTIRGMKSALVIPVWVDPIMEEAVNHA